MEINCPNCGNSLDLPDSAVGRKVRCPFCKTTFIGEAAVIDLAALPDANPSFCLQCDARLPRDAKFCPQCGKALEGSSLTMTAHSHDCSDKIQCSICGKPMRLSSATKCMRCGKYICKTHYDKKLDVCVSCAKVVKREIATQAVEIGLSGDWNQALALAKQAEKNDPRVLYVFAQAYFHGVASIAYHSGEYNRQKYKEYLLSSATGGFPRAQYDLGMLEYGFEKQEPWLQKSAEQDFVPAQLEIAKNYDEGFHKGNNLSGLLVQDPAVAYKWYKRAAEHGDAHAQFRLAKCYGMAQGVELNPDLSVAWLNKSAAQGHPLALQTIGNFSRMGKFMPKDNYKAYENYARAVRCGSDGARRYLLSGITRAKYIAFDLSGGRGADVFPISDFTNTEDVLTWQDQHKTEFLVMRRIEPGSYRTNGKTVQITKPFYIGVFPITQRQWELVVGGRPSHFSNSEFYAMRPVENVQYKDVRGGSINEISLKVDEASFVGILRKKTSLLFDLPSSAQWEYACRAGTNTKFNNGTDSSEGLGRFGPVEDRERVRSESDLSNGTITVGLYRANGWGLYDMHGNVYEYCRDAPAAIHEDAIDPEGGRYNGRVDMRGGCWHESGEYSSSGRCCEKEPDFRPYARSGENNDRGFRVVLNFEEWDSPPHAQFADSCNACFGVDEMGEALDVNDGERSVSSNVDSIDAETVMMDGEVVAEDAVGESCIEGGCNDGICKSQDAVGEQMVLGAET